MWIARAKYEDGSEIEKEFPYTANGNYEKECKEQYEIECGCWSGKRIHPAFGIRSTTLKTDQAFKFRGGTRFENYRQTDDRGNA